MGSAARRNSTKSSTNENRLRQRSVDSSGAVYDLRYRQIYRNRAQGIGILSRHVVLLIEQPNHVSDGLFRGEQQILVKAHCYPGGFRFYARSDDRRSIQNYEPHFDSSERGLESAQANLAIPLRCVRVAGTEQRFIHHYWKVHTRAHPRVA